LPEKFKYSRFGRLEREYRPTPERELNWRSRQVREERAPIVGGIAPFSLLSLRLR